MWAVPFFAPCFFSFFSLLQHNQSLLSCPLFSSITAAVLCFSPFFHHVYHQQRGGFNTADLLTAVYTSSPTTIHFPDWLHLIYPSSNPHPFMPFHSLKLSSTQCSKRLKNTNVCSLVVSLPQLTWALTAQLGDKCFLKDALSEVLVEDADNALGFQVNCEQKKTSFSATQWNGKHLGAKGFFSYICLNGHSLKWKV